MEKYEITWTSRAKKDLHKNYKFNTELNGEEKAFDIVTTVIRRIDALSDPRFVEMGPVDEDFRHLKRGYKKIIVGHLRITYRLSKNKPVVYINRVFDSRQHPSKNK